MKKKDLGIDFYLQQKRKDRFFYFILFTGWSIIKSSFRLPQSEFPSANLKLFSVEFNKKERISFFFSFNQQQDLQMKIWPMAELASHQSPEVSSIICQMWNLYFCTQSLRWCKNTEAHVWFTKQKESSDSWQLFFFFFSVSSGPGVIRLESHHNGDLRGNCQRVWDSVTNSPLILMTGKSTEARTCCARTSVSWEAWVVNWTLKVRLWSSKTS